MLQPLQNIFHAQDYPDLIAGLDHPDDAAVWKVSENRSLVVTTDFFTPVVDDPYDYGAIAAANSLSDIYAMGGEPFLALNIAAFPPGLPHEIAARILQAGAEKAKEAGVVIAGGHTIQDNEPKYGLVALGWVDPNRVLSKGGLVHGDVLYLTKPLGTGVITSAIKGDLIEESSAAIVIDWMKKLNRAAAQLAVSNRAKAATDITGFSLLGHAWEMAISSGVGMKIYFDQLPFHPKVLELAGEWCFPGGAFDNAQYFSQHVEFSDVLSQDKQILLFDPQTSGGLLIGMDSEAGMRFEAMARDGNIPVWKIGEVVSAEKIFIE